MVCEIIMRTVNKLILMIIYSWIIDDLASPGIAIVCEMFDCHFYNMKLKFSLNIFVFQICIVFLILHLF